VTTLIIAEAGVNHNGDPTLARRMVEAAADAGADLVKFQTFNADRLVAPNAPKTAYQERTTGGGTQHAMIRQLELSRAALEMLIAHCRSSRIGFLSSAFDLESLELLVELGADRFKVPSGEITNLPYLRCVGSFGKPVILSSGMSTLGEIESALAVLEAAGTPRSRITVLHCNTDYPTPMEDVNLRAMRTIGAALDVAVGYSDHTIGIEIAVAAVALGATVVEKHFTLDRALPGPDHGASLEPGELKAMVQAIRNVERALGDGIKRPSAGELKNRSIVRKSLVATRAIRAGEPFSADNLTAKRPGGGLSPMRWDEVLGRPAPRDFAPDEVVHL
jgi:N,N'-diacetyllegionaminate synthase